MKKGYYGDVTVIQKMRLRVAYDYEGELTKEKMLYALQNCEIEDITDEEDLETLEVLEIGESSD
jgi:hypothetical protein